MFFTRTRIKIDKKNVMNGKYDEIMEENKIRKNKYGYNF